ncbi:PREDICTED: programmed cell death 1 ligand 1-like isoform X2 [Cyprinodon variegatus]|uniref:programmed cell death 1 ligand 1-like isoform X2 n=1 Tax=Cyprinodon variegatus TaxID=28743 RepID=UPI0007428306|nr:PREDICTED: programmed cell death 1 ligand 1-like isoform X2 [Cyprinodon variegatus]
MKTTGLYYYLQIPMDLTIIALLHVFLQPSLAALFTVEAEQTSYMSEYGGNVVLGCKFSSQPENPQNGLKVIWHWMTSNPQEVMRLEDSVESFASPKYHGRVKLLSDELKNGWAKLQISDLRITDSGSYQCFIQTTEGHDYKTISLSVGAPYKSITKRIETTAEGDKVVLTCQSEGYPESVVVWQNGNLQEHHPNTTTKPAPDNLFKVTSHIEVSSTEKNNYTCNFTKDGYSATFHIPDEILSPHGKNDVLIPVLCIGFLLAALGLGMVTYKHKKGSRSPSTRNCLVDDGENSTSATACLKRDKERELEEIVITEEENLRSHLKARYSEFSLTTKVRCDCDNFAAEELPHRLQNNEGLHVRLQDLLPKAGKVLLLEGPSSSGKTTVANILLSSWTDGAPKFFDGSFLDLLLYVNCSALRGDLFEEARTQLSLIDKVSAEELRTALAKSDKTLLLLDGYKEGNHFSDETLRRFLSDRGSCRVLVTSCPGDCPVLKQTLTTEGTLKLHMQSGKY